MKVGGGARGGNVWVGGAGDNGCLEVGVEGIGGARAAFGEPGGHLCYLG